MHTRLAALFLASLGLDKAFAIEFPQSVAAEMRACEGEPICVFNVFERASASEEFITETGVYSVFALYKAGIEASVASNGDDQKVAMLGRAIRVADEFEEFYGAADMSQPFHILRAEACLRKDDDACFHESAEALLVTEISLRSAAIKREQDREELDCYSKYNLRLPGASAKARADCEARDFSIPLIWSRIKDLRRRGGFGDIGAIIEKAPPGGNPIMRLDTILTEAERRLQ